jgi:hypothetical protein
MQADPKPGKGERGGVSLDSSGLPAAGGVWAGIPLSVFLQAKCRPGWVRLSRPSITVIPAHAGIHGSGIALSDGWIPAFQPV